MSCTICSSFKTSYPPHTDKDCKHKTHIICRRCNTRGHMTHHCSEDWAHWERPTCMEELIPQNIRMRYNITSHTPLTFPIPRIVPIHESHPINQIQIPATYGELKDTIKLYNIKLPGNKKPSSAEYVQALKDWAESTGRTIISNVSNKIKPL